jgi:AP-1 complex subunit mu
MMVCIIVGLNISIFIVKRNFNIVVAVVKRNPNLTLIFAFLHKLVEILIDYFKNLEEESIR